MSFQSAFLGERCSIKKTMRPILRIICLVAFLYFGHIIPVQYKFGIPYVHISFMAFVTLNNLKLLFSQAMILHFFVCLKRLLLLRYFVAVQSARNVLFLVLSAKSNLNRKYKFAPGMIVQLIRNILCEFDLPE